MQKTSLIFLCKFAMAIACLTVQASATMDRQSKCREKCLEQNRECMRPSTSLSKEIVTKEWIETYLPPESLSALEKSVLEVKTWNVESKDKNIIATPQEERASLEIIISSEAHVNHCNKITEDCLKKCGG